MTDLEKLTAWNLAQVGTRETGENAVRYNTVYYGRAVSGAAYPWCCTYIWCGFHECGLSALFLNGGKSAYCPYVAGWAKDHGMWVTEGYREGDLPFYDWDGDGVVDHIGYCLSAAGNTLETVEGNVGDSVRRMTRQKSEVVGAYRPAYPGTPGGGERGTSADTVLPLLQRGSTGGAVTSLQVLLIHRWGLSCGVDGADGDFGPNTENAVKQFQRRMGLTADGAVGPLTWGKLI